MAAPVDVSLKGKEEELQAPPAVGIMSRIGNGISSVVASAVDGTARLAGRFIVPRYLTHATTPQEAKKFKIMETACGGVIQDISEHMTAKIVGDSAVLDGGRYAIKETLEHLIGHICEVFISKGLENPDKLSPEELADHFLASIIKTIKKEFAKEGIEPRQHFINIADKILKKAFPDGVHDAKIPEYLRELLKGKKPPKSGLVVAAAKEKLGVESLSWDTLKVYLAEKLESIYNTLTLQNAYAVTEENTPGIDKLLKTVVSHIDNSAKELTDTPIEFSFAENSNKFLNNILTRLLKGNFTRPQDKEVLDEARTWLLNHIESSFRAIYTHILCPKDGQTPEDRAIEFSEHIMNEAVRVLPETNREFLSIDALDEEGVVEYLTDFREEQELKFHHLAINTILEKIEEATDETKEATLLEAKALLKSIQAFIAIEEILQHEINPNKLQQLLPSFIPATWLLNEFYSWFSPFFVQIAKQLDTITQNGAASKDALVPHNGPEFAGWIDTSLKWAKKLLEEKATALTLELTPYAFINRLICHSLKPNAPHASNAAKKYIDTTLQNLIHIVLEKAIGDKKENPEKALADILDGVLKQGSQAVSELIAQEATSDEEKQAFLKNASHRILESIITKELFNELLPPFLRNSQLWESLVDFLALHLKGLYAQTERLASAEVTEELSVQLPQLKELVETLTKKALSLLEPSEAEQSALDRVKNHLVRSEGVQNLAKTIFPKIIEALLAYHINPQDGLSSETRAARLFMSFVTTMQKGFNKIEDYEKSANKVAWLDMHGYTKKTFQDYRKLHDIPHNSRLDVRDFLLHETSNHVVRALLPKALVEKLVPQEFAFLEIEERLARLTYAFIKDAYDYSHSMKQLTHAESKSQTELLQDVQEFAQKQLQTYFEGMPANEKSWLEAVTHEIFTIESAEDKGLLIQFTTNIYLGIIGFIFKNAKNIPNSDPSKIHGNLLKLIAPIAKGAQEVFLILNSSDRAAKKRERLEISDIDVKNYLKAIGKAPNTKVATLDINKLAYWVAGRKALDRLFTDEQWDQAVPEFLRGVFTKDSAATFAVSAYETFHQTHEELTKEEKVGIELAKNEKGLPEFIDKYFIENLFELLQELGSSDKPVHKSLPLLFDSFLKECYRDESTEVGELRDTIVRRVIYALVGKVLSNSTPVLDNVCELVRHYNSMDNSATATFLLETCVPEEVSKTPLAKLIISQLAEKELVEKIDEIRACQERILQSGKEAKEYLESLDGVKPFLADIIHELDDTLDSIARDKEKITDNFPDYIDQLLKDAILDDELKPLIRSFFHNVVYMILQAAATPKRGQTPESRIVEVLEELVRAFESDSGVAFLQKLIPDSLLKEILPDFLHTIITHEKLVKWFFKPYITQIGATRQKIADENAKPASQNVQDAQKFAKNYLLDYTKPTATRGGLLNYKGVVRELERSVLRTLQDDNNPTLTPIMQEYQNAIVSQITRSLEAQGKLDPNYLSEGLAASLSQFDDNAEIPEAMPDEAAFGAACSARVLHMAFPNGHRDLPVPDVAKPLIWSKITKALEKLFTELTTPDMRKLWVLDRMIPMTTANQALIGQRLQVIEDLRTLVTSGNKPLDFDSRCEAMFSLYTREAAIRKTEERMQTLSLWRPLKWLCTKIATLLTHLAVRVSLAKRLHDMVGNPNNDQKFRRFIWSFLHFNPPVPARNERELKDDLRAKARAAIKSTKLSPGVMRGFLAGQFTDFVFGRNFIQILV